MSGFMSNSTALMVFMADSAKFNESSLRQHVFTPNIDADGKRLGWVGLGDPLDTDFSFGLEQGRFAAFSLRVDTKGFVGCRQPSTCRSSPGKSRYRGKGQGQGKKRVEGGDHRDADEQSAVHPNAD